MTQKQLTKFVDYLLKEKWRVFGPAKHLSTEEKKANNETKLAVHEIESPQKAIGQIFIGPIADGEDLLLQEKLPFYSFKRFFIPEKERLFEYRDNKLNDESDLPLTALIGVDILDLKAVNLYNQAFEKDAYYQRRRRSLLVIGHSIAPRINDNLFEYQFEEDILEHLPFDIFLAQINENSFKVFTGSLKGQRVLEHFGYKNYEHIQFSGPIKENTINERMIKLREKLENKHNQKIWDELGKKCIECGKCTLACPTCFCFHVQDEPGLKEKTGQRTRCWDSCFFQEFSEVAGGHKFLNSTAQRIHFWYFHKFARIPKEFGFMGCVGCRRCANVCPVGIDIAQVLKDIENG